MHLVDTMVGESMAYDDIYWTVQIESIIQWEEMLRGEGINDANPHEHVNRYYNFFCFINIWFGIHCTRTIHMSSFQAFHLVVCVHRNHKRDYFMPKYKDLYEFYILLEDKFAYEINPGANHVEWDISVRSYKQWTKNPKN